MSTNTSPEWPNRIRTLIGHLGVTQAELAERLGIAPSNISRWLRGTHEPTAEAYVALGNLAGSGDNAFFLERAGLDNVPNARLEEFVSSVRISLKDFKLVTSRSVHSKFAGKAAVAVPLIGITAFADAYPPRQNVSISGMEVEDILFAPLAWCPHPERMIGMHVAGDSMLPLIPPGSVIFVDTAVRERRSLSEKLAVVSHRDLGFKVARFQRMKNSDLLISANHNYSPLDVTNGSKWKIFGEVLWWVSRDAVPAAKAAAHEKQA